MSGPLPIPGYLSDDSRTTAEMQSASELFNSVLKEMIGAAPEAPVQTITGNQITPPNNACVLPVDASGGGTLNTIVVTNIRDGQVIFLHSVSATNPITIANLASGTGVPIATFSGQNIVLTNPAVFISLKYSASLNQFQEIFPYPNWGAPGAIGSVTPNSGTFSSLALSSPLAVSNGGTGAATSGAGTLFGNFTGSTAAPSFHSPGTANQVLAVAFSGGGLEYKTITAGANITITPAAGSITIAAAGFTSPMTTLGDMIYGDTGGAAARLVGSITATKQFLTQTGTGSASAVPAWGTIVLGDLPASVVNTNNSQSAGTVFGNFSAAAGAPSYNAAGSANQVLGVQNGGSGLEYKTIAGSSNVTVTQSPGTITISVTGLITNPMSTLGDIIYGASSGTPTRLAGSTTAAKQFLTQTGTGSASAAPGWGSIILSDLPGTVVNTSNSQSAGTLFGNFSSSSGSPSFNASGTASQLLGVQVGGAGLEYKTIVGSGNVTVTPTAGTITISVTGVITNPMTTLGDIIYGASAGAPNRLAGTTSTTKQFLTQTGTGSASAAPLWGAIVLGDLPGSVVNTSTSQSAGTIFGNFSASAGAPSYQAAGTANQVLGVQSGGAGLEYKTIVGSGNVTVTPTAGTITISVSGLITNPMTTLGDIIYGGSSGAASRLAGITTATKQFLTQTGTGSASAAPGWGAIVLGDLPASVVNTSNNQSAGTLLGNFSGTSGAPSFHAPGTTDQILGVAHSGGGLEYKTISGSGIITVTPTAGTITISSSGFSNPMSTLGDIIYGGTSGTASRLAGTTTATKQFLTQTGTGSASAAPGWGAIVLGDLPASVVNTSNNQSAGTLLGNFSGSSAAPTFHAPGTTDQLLGVAHSGGGLEYKSLVAGANITLTNTAGQISIAATGGGSASFPLVNQCRLYGVQSSSTTNCYTDTSSSGSPTLYFGPCPDRGNSIFLYSSGAWGRIAATEVPLTISAADGVWDVYVYNNGGSVAIDSLVSSPSNPVLDSTGQVYVKSGDATRLYVGTIEVISNTIYSWTGNRGIWNAYNRKQVPIAASDPSSSWTWNTAAWRIQRNQTTAPGCYGVSTIRIVAGLVMGDTIYLTRFSKGPNAAYTTAGFIGVGIDQVYPATTLVSGELFCTSYTSGGVQTAAIPYSTTIQQGAHNYQALEYASATAAFYGGASGGMYGTTWC
jgi:hypothetical protein